MTHPRGAEGGALSHAALIEIAARWLEKTKRCGVVITDMTSGSPETPDAIGWRMYVSHLVECKASRADFFADRKKHFRRYDFGDRGLGMHRYYLVPGGLVKASEVPEGWGLLEAIGKRVAVIKDAPEQPRETDRHYEVMLLCSALRRMVVAEGVRGVMCKTYVIENSETPRATVGVAREEISA